MNSLAIVGLLLFEFVIYLLVHEAVMFSCVYFSISKQENRHLTSGDYTDYKQFEAALDRKIEILNQWKIQIPLSLIVYVVVDRAFLFFFPFLA